jgi:hypothetical protein
MPMHLKIHLSYQNIDSLPAPQLHYDHHNALTNLLIGQLDTDFASGPP